MTLVDTNVLIDVFGGDPVWAERSTAALVACRGRGPLAINDTIYAELASGFLSREELDRAVDDVGLVHAPMSRRALFLAGGAFRRYRANGGLRRNVLADFFVGAQASAETWAVLTRDHRLYRRYFPEADIVPVD